MGTFADKAQHAGTCLAALGPGEGLAVDEWGRHEFGGTPPGDALLSKRLVQSV